jgi:hypothetical protein
LSSGTNQSGTNDMNRYVEGVKEFGRSDD